MAILDSLLGVEVTMCCDNMDLAEYPDLDDEVRLVWKHKTVSKYIESVADAEFSFLLKVGPPYEHDCNSLGFFIVLDGHDKELSGILCRPEDLHEEDFWKWRVDGEEIMTPEGVRLKKYRFSKLETTDKIPDKLTKLEMKQMERIGSIEVRVHQMANGKLRNPPQRQLKRSWDKVPENILKGQAISHSISYGDEEILEKSSLYQTNSFMHGWDGPVGIFRFKYRSRADLQNALVIPRTPPPEPARPRSIEDLTWEETRQLARMKYADNEMLRILKLSRCEPLDLQPSRSRTFEDLDENEVKFLAQEKHSEMTGGPTLKQDPSTKQENEEQHSSEGQRTPRQQPEPRQRVSKRQKRIVIDLIEDSDDEPIHRCPT